MTCTKKKKKLIKKKKKKEISYIKHKKVLN